MLNKYGIEIDTPEYGEIVTFKTQSGPLNKVCPKTRKELKGQPQQFKYMNGKLELIDIEASKDLI